MTKRRMLFIPGLFILSAPIMGQAPDQRMRPLSMTPPDAVAQAVPIGRPSPDQILHLSVSMPYGDPAGIAKFVDSVSDPKSPDYRHFLTPEQVGSRFGLSAGQVQKVTSYLTAQGFRIKLVGKNRLSILADATVAQAEKAFHTTLENYASLTIPSPRAGLYSFTNPPSLPADIAPSIVHIGGLESFTRPKPRSTYESPAQLRQLYNTAPIYNASLRGQGRTIGISNFGGYRLSALTNFYSQFSLPAPAGGVGSNISIETIDGGAGTGVQEGEGDLDIQCVLAVAPLCNLIIYDAADNDLIDTLTLEVNDNKADVITESYGWQLTTTGAASAHNLHLSMSAQGITYTVASGDYGTTLSYPYPDYDPEPLLVGGTTVTTDTSGDRLAEVGWTGSGGGWYPSTDAFNVLPSYQRGTGVPTTIPYRLSPDVALDADPNTGYVIYLVAGNYDFGGETQTLAAGFYIFGGTSAASPTFAASLALAEQKLISTGSLPANSAGKQRFGRIQDLLYSYNGNASVFYDVTSGANGTLPNGAASIAGPGWDFVTGWGAMNFSGFVTKYSGSTTAPLPKISSVALSASSVAGGSSTAVTGTVTIASAAPTGGSIVTLASSNAAVTVPASLTVAAGATTATFSVTTSSVTASRSVTITATGSNSATATLTVTPQPLGLSGVILTSSAVYGGASITGTVSLTDLAPTGGAKVTLALSSTTHASLSASSVTIPAGVKAATFTIKTSPVSAVTSPVVTATYVVAETATFTINPPIVWKVGTSSSSLVGGVTNPTITVILNGAAGPAGATVALTAGPTAAANFSSSTLLIAAGKTSGTATLTTFAVSATTSVTVTATDNASETTTVSVNPAVLSGLSLSVSTVVGGSSTVVTGTVTLSGPAGPGGASIALSSNSTAAPVPATVSVAAGSKTATFTFTTKAVTKAAKATITAKFGATTKTARLTIDA